MKAHELLSDESKWTKGVSARDADGQWEDYRSGMAVKWCIKAAIWRCYDTEESRSGACRKVASIVGPDISKWNDSNSTTFADVRRVLLEANV